MKSWRPVLEVDLGAIAANWTALKRLAPDAECAAVVKADAYGLGAEHVAPRLEGEGAQTFFVATAAEGIRLRRLLGAGPSVYVMNGVASGELQELAQGEIRPVLSTGEQCRQAIRYSREVERLTCGIQVDSGMNRLGLSEAETAILTGTEDVGELLDVRLLMSHLGSADEEGHPANERQARHFDRTLSRISPLFPGARRSLAATAGVLLGARFHYDLVRPGIGLYGGLPFRAARPVVSLRVPILQVRSVATGDTLGYGRDWRAERDSRIATLPIGYADGVFRCLGGAGGRGCVRIGGRLAPLAGRVNMDLVTVDVTEMPEAIPGGWVELLGPQRGIDKVAEAAGTIGHEILTSLRGSSRLDRRYLDSGRAG